MSSAEITRRIKALPCWRGAVTLTPEGVRRPDMLPRIVELVKRCDHEIPKHQHGPTLDARGISHGKLVRRQVRSPDHRAASSHQIY